MEQRLVSGRRVLELPTEQGVGAKGLTVEQRALKARVRQAAARLYAEYGAAYAGRRRVASAAGADREAVARLYPEEADLLADVLGEHVWGLSEAVCRGFDAAAAGPFERLEAVARAWLDHVAAEHAEHRSLVFCVRLLPAAMRESVTLRYRITLDTVMEALGAAVPGLAEQGEAMESLRGTARALLSDAGWEWTAAAERARAARRIAGMLVAAAEAELAGAWGTGRPVAGVEDGRVHRLESHVARKRWKELLDAVKAGAEVIVTRRGRNVVRMVQAVG